MKSSIASVRYARSAMILLVAGLSLSMAQQFSFTAAKDPTIIGNLRKGASFLKRELQTVMLHYDGSNQVEEDSILFTGSGAGSGTGVISTGGFTCRSIKTYEDDSVEDVASTTVPFVYEVETADTSESDIYANTTVPRGVDAASVNALGETFCQADPCIIGFYQGTPADDLLEGEPCNSVDGSGSCFQYNGNIKVTYSLDPALNCDKDTIEDMVYGELESTDESTGERDGAMAESGYIEYVNGWGEVYHTEDPSTLGTVNVVRIVAEGYKNTDKGAVVAGIAGTPAAISSSSSSMSPAAWVVAALLLLLLLLLLFLWYRRRRNQKEKERKMEDDLKSIKTDWSAAGMSAGTGGNSYMTADMRNLAALHSKLDVHKCKSATCEICSRPQIGKVDMLPVNQKETSTALAMAMAQVREAQEIHEETRPLQEERRVPTPTQLAPVVAPPLESTPPAMEDHEPYHDEEPAESFVQDPAPYRDEVEEEEVLSDQGATMAGAEDLLSAEQPFSDEEQPFSDEEQPFSDEDDFGEHESSHVEYFQMPAKPDPEEGDDNPKSMLL